MNKQFWYFQQDVILAIYFIGVIIAYGLNCNIWLRGAVIAVFLLQIVRSSIACNKFSKERFGNK